MPLAISIRIDELLDNCTNGGTSRLSSSIDGRLRGRFRHGRIHFRATGQADGVHPRDRKQAQECDRPQQTFRQDFAEHGNHLNEKKNELIQPANHYVVRV